MTVLFRQWIRDLFAEDRLGGQFVGIVILAGLTFVVAFNQWVIRSSGGMFLELTPWSVFSLTLDEWSAVCVTCIVTGLFFIVNWGIGYWLGVLAGLLSMSVFYYGRLISHIINNVMQMLYVIPVVLTLAIVQTPTILAITDHRLEPYWGVVLPVLVGVFILSGYQVYESCYNSVASPDDRQRRFVDSLYVPIPSFVPAPVQPFVQRMLSRYAVAGRRIDCQIRLYNDALKRALHLAFVAVVIVEMVIPGLYRPLWISDGGWVYGIGGLVGRLRGTAQLSQVAGMVWALLAFDILLQAALRFFLRRRFERHYTES